MLFAVTDQFHEMLWCHNEEFRLPRNNKWLFIGLFKLFFIASKLKKERELKHEFEFCPRSFPAPPPPAFPVCPPVLYIIV